MEAPVNRVWRVARPMGPIPTPDDFVLVEEPVAQPGPGQVLMRTIYLGVAPGVRPLLPYAGAVPDVANDGSAGRSDASADDLPDPMRIRVGERMRSGIVPSMSVYAGGTVGKVIASRHPGFASGDYIFGGRLWQDYEVVDGDAALRLDPAVLPIEAELSVLGRSAFTGWVGYRRFAGARMGETIVVSAAAGAVGMIVVQMAKAQGLRVIGIASGPDKCAFVTGELGADACIDRLDSNVGVALDAIAPAGIDIYFDNVGGNVQAPVFARLKPFGRMVVCGMAAEYGGLESSSLPTGLILAKRLRIEGFVVLDHEDDYAEFRADVARMLRDGALVYRTQVYQGLEQAPQALADCLTGANPGGKVLVQVAEAASVG